MSIRIEVLNFPYIQNLCLKHLISFYRPVKTQVTKMNEPKKKKIIWKSKINNLFGYEALYKNVYLSTIFTFFILISTWGAGV